MYRLARASQCSPAGRPRKLRFLVAAAGLTFAALPLAPASAVDTPRIGFQGHGFGTYVTLAGKARSGPSSVVALGCGAPAGFRTRNSAATASLPSTVSSATLATTGSTSASPDRTAITAGAQHVDVLEGRVTADAVKSISISTHDSSGYHTSSAGSSFKNLRVLGVPVGPLDSTPAPNTTIALPGLGHVVLNEQVSTITATSASLSVYSIHAYVTSSNALGVPVGTNIIVAGSYSAINAPTGGFLSGLAYGSQARVGTVLRSGPSFSQFLPCTGTGGALNTNTGAGINVDPYLVSGVATNTARGSTTDTTATAQMTSDVASGKVLGNLIQASSVKAVVRATRTNGHVSLNDTGSNIGHITVNGKAFPRAIPSNTVRVIDGVGTLYLHRKIVTANSIEVRMVELVVTKANPFHLPIGTDLQLGVARVSIR